MRRPDVPDSSEFRKLVELFAQTERFGHVSFVGFFLLPFLLVFRFFSFQKNLGCVFQLVRDSDVPEPRGYLFF